MRVIATQSSSFCAICIISVEGLMYYLHKKYLHPHLMLRAPAITSSFHRASRRILDFPDVCHQEWGQPNGLTVPLVHAAFFLNGTYEKWDAQSHTPPPLKACFYFKYNNKLTWEAIIISTPCSHFKAKKDARSSLFIYLSHLSATVYTFSTPHNQLE